jgi:hypothetical protein
MSKVVIVARTRMQHEKVCIGGHDLDRDFRSVRLLDRYGGYEAPDLPFLVGEVWDIRYSPKNSARPPHVEDVYINDKRRIGRVPDLKALVLKCTHPWEGGPEMLFDGTVRGTPGGGGYIPMHGMLPGCSTGYWLPDRELSVQVRGTRVRVAYKGDGPVGGFPWVGVQPPPERIPAGSLVRVSLTRPWKSETSPEGHYVQVSGVL